MNAIAAHKDELQKLLADLSSDRLVSGITFVALVNAYIATCLGISARVSIRRQRKQTENQYNGTNIDSKPHALLRARYNFGTARRALSQISRCGPQASARCSPATGSRRTF